MTNPQPPLEGGRDILAILLLSLAAGILLIVGLVVVLVSFAPPSDPWVAPVEEPVADDTFDPTAPAPPPAPSDSVIDCGQPCFAVEDARSLAPTADQLGVLGSPAQVELLADAGVQQDWESRANEAFYLGDGEPLACVFAITPAPIAPQSQSYTTRDDPVVDLGRFESDAVTVTQMARVSEAVLYGARYPNSVTSVINRCPGYTATLDGRTRDATLSPLELGISKAGLTDVVWTQTYGSTVVTTADLVRGNLIVRVEVTREAGAVADSAVEAYIEAVASGLSALPAP